MDSSKRHNSSGFLPYFSYRLLGKRFNFFYPLFKNLKSDMLKSNMKIGFQAYVCQMFFVTILSALACFSSFSIINILAPQFLWMIFPPNLTYLLTLIVLPLVVGCGAFIIQYALPTIKAGTRKGRIENYLSITSSHMAVLASAGVDPEKIVRIVAQADPKMVLSDEIGSLLVKMDLLGYNIISALEEGVSQSPSVLYSNLLKGFAYTVRTGGNLRRFFLQSTSQLLDRRNKMIQQFLSTLAMLAETYVLMFAAFPLLLIIMLSVMASVGGTLGGFDLVQLMYIFTFVMMPVMAMLYIFVIELIQPKG
jgi:flagellar protein FlaJ